jgi:type II restriction enzyme
MTQLTQAKTQLDTVIRKARVHLYKPIQIAEVLYRDRTSRDIDVNNLETFRTQSRAWRDAICFRFLNRTSTSSARYQDDVFNDNATPPEVLSVLARENKAKNGIVEAYIYKSFQKRQFQMIGALSYANDTEYRNFDLDHFLNMFWDEPGLRRSLDKIFEIVVYALFLSVIKELQATIRLSIPNEKLPLLNEFQDFTKSLMGITPEVLFREIPASVNRVGATNAADRGLDMWANFGPAIQIKHLSLTEELAGDIVKSVSAEKIVIVCKTAEERIVNTILAQLGLRDRVQSIITEDHLRQWYEKALRGPFSAQIGPKLIQTIRNELLAEFPTSNQNDFIAFLESRNYHTLNDNFWTLV